ncbi:MAG: class I SAM-dependent methyltransferase [Candidatus Latescibacterota bacterium]
MPDTNGHKPLFGEVSHTNGAKPANEEIERVRSAYETRDAGMPYSDWKKNIYHPRHPLGKLFHEHHHNLLLEVLNVLDADLAGLRVLDVGCGHGNWLRDLVDLGAVPGQLTGIDLSKERIEAARQMNPGIRWIHGNSAELPFPSQSFDLVMQAVVFSSILDDSVHTHLADEMARVTRPGGHILWVDHKRPFSAELSGFPISRVLELFEGFQLEYTQSVHPRYFRRMYRRFGIVARAMYRMTKIGCDSWALILTKES